MGCDIHFFVETKQPDGSWKSVDEWSDDDGYKFVPYEKEFYGDRNYSLFAILADVRNGYGFAGIKTGDGYNPIEAPRGLPSDVSHEVKENSESWGVDGHSHSWFTLAELKEYDWDQETQRQGVISLDEYKEYVRTGRPRSWSGGVRGSKVKNISNDEMNAMLKASNIIQDGFEYYTTVRWTETYRMSVGSFLTDTLTKMEALGNPENVRAVFWFDN